MSKRLRKRIWFVPAYNLPLAAVFGTVQVLLVFMLGLHLDDKHRDLGIADLLRAMWESPTAFLLSLLVLRVAGRDGALRPRRARDPRLLIGLFHSTLQVGSVAGMMIAASLRLVRPGGRVVAVRVHACSCGWAASAAWWA